MCSFHIHHVDDATNLCSLEAETPQVPLTKLASEESLRHGKKSLVVILLHVSSLLLRLQCGSGLKYQNRPETPVSKNKYT